SSIIWKCFTDWLSLFHHPLRRRSVHWFSGSDLCGYLRDNSRKAACSISLTRRRPPISSTRKFAVATSDIRSLNPCSTSLLSPGFPGEIPDISVSSHDSIDLLRDRRNAHETNFKLR